MAFAEKVVTSASTDTFEGRGDGSAGLLQNETQNCLVVSTHKKRNDTYYQWVQSSEVKVLNMIETATQKK